MTTGALRFSTTAAGGSSSPSRYFASSVPPITPSPYDAEAVVAHGIVLLGWLRLRARGARGVRGAPLPLPPPVPDTPGPPPPVITFAASGAGCGRPAIRAATRALVAAPAIPARNGGVRLRLSASMPSRPCNSYCILSSRRRRRSRARAWIKRNMSSRSPGVAGRITTDV